LQAYVKPEMSVSKFKTLYSGQIQKGLLAQDGFLRRLLAPSVQNSEQQQA
jgi:hypothetical protein